MSKGSHFEITCTILTLLMNVSVDINCAEKTQLTTPFVIIVDLYKIFVSQRNSVTMCPILIGVFFSIEILYTGTCTFNLTVF